MFSFCPTLPTPDSSKEKNSKKSDEWRKPACDAARYFAADDNYLLFTMKDCIEEKQPNKNIEKNTEKNHDNNSRFHK